MGGAKPFHPRARGEKCQCEWWLVYEYVYASKTPGSVRQWGAGSLSAAGGGTGLVEAQGFAHPTGKVHFLHFWAFYERVTLNMEKQMKTIVKKNNWGMTQWDKEKLQFRYPPSTSSDRPCQLGFWSNCGNKKQYLHEWLYTGFCKWRIK